jgi:eukaryotic-like serine/threonine-protein kinase
MEAPDSSTRQIPDHTPLFSWRFADAQYNEATGELQVAGAPVQMEPRPLRVLGKLLRHCNEVVTKEELLEEVWQGRVTVENVVANAVTKLRRGLGESAGSRILSVPRMGYRLIGQVERIAVGSPHAVALELRPGGPVPRRPGFALVKALGVNSKGQVWLARNDKTDLIRVFKFANDADTLRALKREFTLHRILRHELGPREDLVSLVDTNFVEAPFFLECEFGGEDLLSWAEVGQRLADMPAQTRMDMFVKIANAVAAAHSVGVLHKDIKPANVLVQLTNGIWQPRLIDFGSGRALDPQRLKDIGLTAMGLTMTLGSAPGALTGTPLYLAPELLAGQGATAQSDVYALGILLYQMTVGDLRRPLATGWEREINCAFLISDIAAATDRDPERRISTAAELVQRLLKVETRRTDAKRLAELELERNKAIEDLRKRQVIRPWIAALLIAFLVGTVASLLLARQARREQALAQAEASRASRMYSFLAHDLFKRSEVLQIGGDTSINLKRLLGNAAKRAESRFKEDPRMDAELAYLLGDMYLRAGIRAGALQHLQRSVDILAASGDDPNVRPAYDRSLSTLSLAMALGRQTKEAEDVVARVSENAQQDKLTRLTLADAKFRIAYNKQSFQTALPLARNLLAAADELPKDLSDLRIIAWSSYGDLLFRLERYDEAGEVFSSLLKAPFEMEAAGPLERLRAELDVAKVKLVKSNFQGMETELNRIRDEAFTLNGPSEHLVLAADSELMRLHMDLGDFTKAEVYAKRALEGNEFAQGAQHVSTHYARFNLALNELRNGHAASALRNLDLSRRSLITQSDQETGPVAQVIDFARAQALIDVANPAPALTILRKLNPKTLAQGSAGEEWAMKVDTEHGRALLALGRRAEALVLLQRAAVNIDAKGMADWEKKQLRSLLAQASAR